MTTYTVRSSAQQDVIDAAKVAKVTSTDNAIVRFDGITGAVQNSSIFIDDSGNLGIGTSNQYNLTNWKTITMDGTNGSGLLQRANGINGLFMYSNSTASTVSEQRASPLIFETTGFERMRIDPAGNVGIGTNSPANRLSVANTPTGAQVTNSTIELVQKNSNGSTRPVLLKSFDGGLDNGSAFSISTASVNDTASTERVRITSTGNLLVGTATDNGVDKLQVQGSISIRPLISATPTNNGDLTFEATSNTSVKIKLKGSDGVVRSVTLTLA